MVRAPVIGSPAGQERLAMSARGPFCQAAAPAATAVLAWANLILASWPGGTSMSLTHWRVADSRCLPPTARPAKTIKVPAPVIAALMISGAALNSGPFLRLSPSVMAPSLSCDLTFTVGQPAGAAHHPHRVMRGP